MMDDPRHPRLGEYVDEHTRRWSRLVDAADAFVFVTPGRRQAECDVLRHRAASGPTRLPLATGCANPECERVPEVRWS